MLDYLSGLGLDVEQLLETSHIDASVFTSPDLQIGSEQYQGLLSAALAKSGDNGLGLKIGLNRSLATLDQLSSLMMSSATLRESTQTAMQYQNFSGRFSGGLIINSFSEINGQGCYQVHARPELGELRIMAIEDILGNILTVSKWVLGKPLPVTELFCDYPAPPHQAMYSEVFNCPVHFDSASTQLFFDATILDEPLPQSSPQSARLLEKICQARSIEQNQGDFAWRVWHIVLRDPAAPPTLEEVAQLMHCSSRTLSRRLLAQGWKYQQLVDQVREIYARRYLSDPTMPVSQVAERLGYSDGASFNRAFRKWTGISPSEFKSGLK